MDLKVSVREIVESAMLIALAVILDLDGLKIPVGATGGSISFTIIPLIVLALRLNFIKSFIFAGVCYGLIACLKDGYGMQTYLFEYFFAYGSVSIASLFKEQILDETKPFKGILFIVLSITIHTIIRFVFATLSSMINWDYGLIPALIYNAVYVPLTGLVTLGAVLLLYKPILIVNKKFPTKSIWLML